MTSDAGRRWSRVGSAIALALFVVALFAYSVRVRSRWFGKPADGHAFWLTAHSLLVLENWWEEGALATRFALFENPPSVEHRTTADRSPYVSYPAGAFLPPYALARLTGVRPTVALLMSYDLANHLAIALVLAALGAAMARETTGDERLAALFGAVPAATMLLTPGPMYWLQNIYFADQAVILPFVLSLALEWFRDQKGRSGRLARRLAPWVLLWGCFVDYLFVFVTLALFLKRWLAGEYGFRPDRRRKATLLFWLPAVAALALFGLQLAAVSGFRRMADRALLRAGPPSRNLGGDFADPWLFWLPHARSQYGKTGVLLLALSAIALLGLAAACRTRALRATDAGHRLARRLSLGALALVPCAGQLLALRNHSSIHDFSVLKLAVPLALIPGVVVPLAAIELLRARGSFAGIERRFTVAITFAAAAGTAAYLAQVYPKFRAQFPAPQVAHHRVAELLRERSGYGDIVFSPDFEIQFRPPQLLAIARERVYPVADPGDFASQAGQLTAGLSEPYRLCLLFASQPIPAEWRRFLRGTEQAGGGGARLFCGVRAGFSRQKTRPLRPRLPR